MTVLPCVTHRQEPALPRLRLTLVAFAVLSSATPFTLAAGQASYRGEVQKITDDGLGGGDVAKALDVLDKSLQEARAKVPAAVAAKMEESVAANLQAARENVSQRVRNDYKKALLTVRVLELSQAVRVLPLRRIPGMATERAKASAQYAKLAARLESQRMSKEVREMVAFPIRLFLEKLQNDVFTLGYGQPLTKEEYSRADAILSNLVERGAKLSDQNGPGSVKPTLIRDAAAIATDARRSLQQLSRDREAAVIGDPATLDTQLEAALKTAHERLNAVTKAETDAMFSQFNADEQKRRSEDSPAGVAAKRVAADEEQEHHHDHRQGGSGWALLMGTSVFLFVFLICANALRRRRQQ